MTHTIRNPSVQDAKVGLALAISALGYAVYLRSQAFWWKDSLAIHKKMSIFGNPKVGSALMKCRQSVGIDLPLKALVWTDAQGKTWISYDDPRYLEKRHDITGCEEVLAKTEKALAGIAKSAATE